MTPELKATCPICTFPVEAGWTYCMFCGTRVQSPSAAPLDAAHCVRHPEQLAAGACSRCGAFSCGECLGPPRAPGVAGWCHGCRVQEGEFTLPWDERGTQGLWRAFFRTAWLFVKSPLAAYARAHGEASVGSSLLFAALAQVLAFSGTAVFYSLAFGGVAAFGLLSEGGEDRTGVMALAAVGIFVAAILGATLYGVGITLVHAGLDHLVLRLFRSQPPRAFSVTLRAAALSSAPMLLGVVPLCSFYVQPLWSLVLRVLGYKELHGVPTGQALVGAVAVPLVAFALGMSGYLLLLGLLPGLR